MERFDLEERYPEAFEGLTDRQRTAVVDALVAGWHEGWEPTKADVQNLSDYVLGKIDSGEYRRRADAEVQRIFSETHR